jgi:hypothetical protein
MLARVIASTWSDFVQAGGVERRSVSLWRGLKPVPSIDKASTPGIAVEDVPSFVELRWRSGEHQAALTW